MSIGTQIRAFAKTKPGYVVLMAIVVALGGLSLGALGIPVGAIILLAFGFGLPIYFRWNGSLRKFLSVPLAMLLFGTLFVGIVTTSSILTPPGPVSSPDGVLQNATETPFQSGGSHPVFTLSVDVYPSKEAKGIRLNEVYVWVTNCEADTDTSHGNCYLSPPSVFHNLSEALTPGANGTQNATGAVPVSFELSGLPLGQVYFFIFFTAVSSVNASSVLYYGLNSNVGGWSCTVPASYSSCFWTTGPVPATWGQVYLLLYVDDLVSMALTAGVLASIILIYSYLKGRERIRRDKARAAAGGESTGPGTTEIRCPNCNAVVEKGETKCWKCKKDIASPPTPASSQPLPSSTPADAAPDPGKPGSPG